MCHILYIKALLSLLTKSVVTEYKNNPGMCLSYSGLLSQVHCAAGKVVSYISEQLLCCCRLKIFAAPNAENTIKCAIGFFMGLMVQEWT